MFATVKIFVLNSIFLFAGCFNPMAPIKEQQKEFEKNYKNNHIQYEVGGYTMHFAWSGDPQKRAIIFIHGSPGSYETWAHFLVDKDLQKRFQLIAVDRPGYGLSQKSKSGFSLQSQAELIFAALKFNHSNLKPILVGYSYGGAVAARILADRGTEIGGALFVAASVDPTVEKPKWYDHVVHWSVISSLLPEDLRTSVDETMSLNGELQDMQNLWKDIHLPVAIIQGDSDTSVAPENEQFIKDQLGKNVIRSTRVPGLNHYVPWRRADLILENIDLLDKELLR